MAEVAVFGASSEVGTAGRLKLLHKGDDREGVGQVHVRYSPSRAFRAMSRKPRFSSSRTARAWRSSAYPATLPSAIVRVIASNASAEISIRIMHAPSCPQSRRSAAR